MASRLLTDTIITVRDRREIPGLSSISRAAARRAILILTIFGLLMFMYLMEVSQATTTVFDIEQLELEYHQWQERNRELERRIAEMESPEHVIQFAEAHGMVPDDKVEYLIIEAGR